MRKFTLHSYILARLFSEKTRGTAIALAIHTIKGDNSKYKPFSTSTFYPPSSNPQVSVGTRMRCSCFRYNSVWSRQRIVRIGKE